MFFTIEQNMDLQRCVTSGPKLDVSFISGILLDKTKVPNPLEVNGLYDKANPPSHFEDGVMTLFSNKLIDSLQAFGVDNLQTFPATIVGTDGTKWKDYQAVQIIGIIRCADMNNSTYETIGPGNDELAPLCIFDEVQIDAEKVPSDLKIFRLMEAPGTIIINEPLLQWLIDNRPSTGWGFDAYQASDPVTN